MKDDEVFVNEEADVIARMTYETLVLTELRGHEKDNSEAPFQRNFSIGKARAISEKLMLFAITVLVVSRREDGSSVIIDGRHRRWALLKNGYSEWKCQVLHGLTREEEARLFILLNTQRGAPRAYDCFRAALCSGDPTALRIRETCDLAGMKIREESGVAGCTKSVYALTKIYQRTSAVKLKIVLECVFCAWKDDEYNGNGDVLCGVWRFLEAVEWNPDILAKLPASLSRTSIAVLKRRATTFRELERVSMEMAITKTIQEQYNKGRSTGKVVMAKAG